MYIYAYMLELIFNVVALYSECHLFKDNGDLFQYINIVIY